MWDRDTELTLYTRNRWSLAEVKMDFRTGKADIAQINRFFSALIIGVPTDAKVDLGAKDYSSGKQQGEFISGKSMGLLDNCWEIDASEMDSSLRSNPALLLKEENVLRAFQSGRDKKVFTNRRLILMDVKGITGKRMEYKSIPYKYICGYEFETCGHLDRDFEVYQYTDIAEVKSERFPRIVPCLRNKESILAKNTDVYEIGKLMTDHFIFSGNEYAEEPEIVL